MWAPSARVAAAARASSSSRARRLSSRARATKARAVAGAGVGRAATECARGVFVCVRERESARGALALPPIWW